MLTTDLLEMEPVGLSAICAESRTGSPTSCRAWRSASASALRRSASATVWLVSLVAACSRYYSARLSNTPTASRQNLTCITSLYRLCSPDCQRLTKQLHA